MTNAPEMTEPKTAALGFEDALPGEQWTRTGEPPLDPRDIHRRRESAFLLLSGIFLGSLTMLNILGLTRFIDLSFTLPFTAVEVPVPLAVGVLPYPITFLCTDFISELYGRKRANRVVWMGLALNVWVVFIVWLGGALPLAPHSSDGTYQEIQKLAFGGVAASMIAYLTAQFIDVQLFHFWKKLTQGRHLWLRNNGSTLVSQLVDTVAVVLITHYWAGAMPVDHDAPIPPQLLQFITALYVFKLIAAAIDTLPFYLGVHLLSRYLRLPRPGAVLDRTVST